MASWPPLSHKKLIKNSKVNTNVYYCSIGIHIRRYYRENANSYFRYRDSTYYRNNRFIVIIAQPYQKAYQVTSQSF